MTLDDIQLTILDDALGRAQTIKLVCPRCGHVFHGGFRSVDAAKSIADQMEERNGFFNAITRHGYALVPEDWVFRPVHDPEHESFFPTRYPDDWLYRSLEEQEDAADESSSIFQPGMSAWAPPR